MSLQTMIQKVADGAGSVYATPAAFAAIVFWAVWGPSLDYSDAWQLTVNTSTTIVTFILVFIIQNTQTRDTLELKIMLMEILRAQPGADNALLEIEGRSQRELRQLLRLIRLEPHKTPTETEVG